MFCLILLSFMVNKVVYNNDAGHSIALNKTVRHGCLVATLCTSWPCDFDLWLFDLRFIGGRDIVMDYHSAKFDHCIFSRFGFILRRDRQTEWQNRTQSESQSESQRRMNAILTRLPSASVIILYTCYTVLAMVLLKAWEAKNIWFLTTI